MAKLGFIGIGNMGGALAKAAAKKVPGKEILVSSKRWEHARDFAQEHQLVASTNESVARGSKFVILGVKPQYMEEVLGGLKPILEVRTDAVLVTMAAGLTMDNIASMLGGGYPVIRIMPNTPAGVGQGLIVYDANDRVNQADLNEFLDLMEGAGLFPAAGASDRRRQRRGRMQPRFLLPDFGSHGRRGRGLRSAPGQGAGLCRPSHAGHGAAGAHHRAAPRCPEGRRLLPRGQHHPGRPGAGAGRSAQQYDGGGDRRL